MMRGRNLLILAGILVALALIAFAIDSSRRHQTQSTGKTLFPELKTDLVDRIKIRWQEKEAVLEKRDDKWYVATEGNHLAEQKYATDILERLPKFYADQVVSTNPANQSLFQVDSTGVEVWVNQKGKEIGHFYIGKPGPDFTSTYVRAASSPKVIQVAEYLPTLFQRSDTWREKTIFALDQQNINRVEYVSPKRGRVVVRKDDSGNWHMDEPDTGSVETAKLNVSLRAIASLKARGFEDSLGTAATGLDADTTHVALTLADGSTHVLLIGATAPGSQRYVRKQDAEQIFTIPIGSVNTMTPLSGALLKRP